MEAHYDKSSTIEELYRALRILYYESIRIDTQWRRDKEEFLAANSDAFDRSKERMATSLENLCSSGVSADDAEKFKIDFPPEVDAYEHGIAALVARHVARSTELIDKMSGILRCDNADSNILSAAGECIYAALSSANDGVYLLAKATDTVIMMRNLCDKSFMKSRNSAADAIIAAVDAELSSEYREEMESIEKLKEQQIQQSDGDFMKSLESTLQQALGPGAQVKVVIGDDIARLIKKASRPGAPKRTSPPPTARGGFIVDDSPFSSRAVQR